ncbi:MAG TPA: hypothetical protein VH518_19615, partial [Tepidisphaeraceae bacterium]
MKGWTSRSLGVVGMLLLMAAVSSAQTSRPVSTNAYDDQPIRRNHVATEAPTTRDAGTATASISPNRS